MGLKVVNAEYTTTAKAAATASVRNAMSFFAMSHVVLNVLNVPPVTILNSDGTSFTVGATDKIGTKSIALKTSPENTSEEQINQIVAPEREKTFGLYTIKVYITINGNGNIFDPVFIIQDEAMDEDSCEIHEVPGLGATAAICTKGFIAFLKSRAHDESFFEGRKDAHTRNGQSGWSAADLKQDSFQIPYGKSIFDRSTSLLDIF